MKVLFASGGSGGPVSPLIAIYEKLKERDPNVESFWIGTAEGPEKKMIKPYKINFRVITSGKLRRYFSWKNFLTPLSVLIGFFQSLIILRRFKPDVVLSAGSFIAVPVVYAAWVLRIPRFIHQQDIKKGLANKLMEKFATAITVTFADSAGDFDIKKTFHIGNPVRKMIFEGSKERALKFFKLKAETKTLLVTGGGQGAGIINQTLLESLGELTKYYQIIHLTGMGNGIESQINNYYDHQTQKQIMGNYRSYELLNKEMFDALKLADLVVSRAGLSILTEMAVLEKPAILIPLPGHQDVNALYFAKFNAVKVIMQNQLNKEVFIKLINQLMGNPADLQGMSRNISQVFSKEAASQYVELIDKFLAQENK